MKEDLGSTAAAVPIVAAAETLTASHAAIFVLFVAKQFHEFCDGALWEGWQEMAEEFGIIEQTPYIEAVHGGMNFDAEEGDEIYVLTEHAKRVIADARAKTGA